MIRPGPADVSKSDSASERSDEDAATEPAEILAVIALASFERFVFVMSVLERYSDQECSLLLDCSRGEVTGIIVESDEPSTITLTDGRTATGLLRAQSEFTAALITDTRIQLLNKDGERYREKRIEPRSDWLNYHGSFGAGRYSALEVINRSTVSRNGLRHSACRPTRLRSARWRFGTSPPPARRRARSRATCTRLRA